MLLGVILSSISIFEGCMQNYRINLLQRLVRERGLHKNKIAHLAGISPNSLSRLLKGTNQLNSVETIEGLARALNVHPGIFFGDFEMMDYVQREVIDLPLIVGFINIIKKEIMENSERIPTPKSMLRDIDIVSEETFWV